MERSDKETVENFKSTNGRNQNVGQLTQASVRTEGGAKPKVRNNAPDLHTKPKIVQRSKVERQGTRPLQRPIVVKRNGVVRKASTRAVYKRSSDKGYESENHDEENLQNDRRATKGKSQANPVQNVGLQLERSLTQVISSEPTITSPLSSAVKGESTASPLSQGLITPVHGGRNTNNGIDRERTYTNVREGEGEITPIQTGANFKGSKKNNSIGGEKIKANTAKGMMNDPKEKAPKNQKLDKQQGKVAFSTNGAKNCGRENESKNNQSKGDINRGDNFYITEIPQDTELSLEMEGPYSHIRSSTEVSLKRVPTSSSSSRRDLKSRQKPGTPRRNKSQRVVTGSKIGKSTGKGLYKKDLQNSKTSSKDGASKSKVSNTKPKSNVKKSIVSDPRISSQEKVEYNDTGDEEDSQQDEDSTLKNLPKPEISHGNIAGVKALEWSKGSPVMRGKHVHDVDDVPFKAYQDVTNIAQNAPGQDNAGNKFSRVALGTPRTHRVMEPLVQPLDLVSINTGTEEVDTTLDISLPVSCLESETNSDTGRTKKATQKYKPKGVKNIQKGAKPTNQGLKTKFKKGNASVETLNCKEEPYTGRVKRDDSVLQIMGKPPVGARPSSLRVRQSFKRTKKPARSGKRAKSDTMLSTELKLAVVGAGSDCLRSGLMHHTPTHVMGDNFQFVVLKRTPLTSVLI